MGLCKTPPASSQRLETRRLASGASPLTASEFPMPPYKYTSDFRIARLRVKNFRSIRDVDVELEPLTILVGPNASGKSNVLDALRFTSDAIRYGLDRALSDRNGIGEVRRRTPAGADIPNVGVGFEVVYQDWVVEYGFSIGSDADGRYWVKEETIAATRPDASWKIAIEDGNIVHPRSMAANGEGDDGDDADFDRSTLALPFLIGMIRTIPCAGAGDCSASGVREVLRGLKSGLGGMQFYNLSPDSMRAIRHRENPYPLARDGENLSSALAKLQEKSPKHLKRLAKYLHLMFPDITGIRVKSIGGYLVPQLRRGNAQGKDASPWFDLGGESDGTIRLLGLLIALYQLPYPSLIGIEEPETTIHPGQLSTLSEFLGESAIRSNVVLTTHNPDLIDYLVEEIKTEGLRVVQTVDGDTNIGGMKRSHAKIVRDRLFTSGEIHSMWGLDLH